MQKFYKLKRQNQKSLTRAKKNQTITVKTVIDYLFYLPKIEENNGKSSKTSKSVATQG